MGEDAGDGVTDAVLGVTIRCVIRIGLDGLGAAVTFMVIPFWNVGLNYHATRKYANKKPPKKTATLSDGGSPFLHRKSVQ